MKKLIFVFSILSLTLLSCEKEVISPLVNTNTNSGESDGGYHGGSTGGCPTVQCHATAVSTGQRCQRMTTNCSGYCWQHD